MWLARPARATTLKRSHPRRSLADDRLSRRECWERRRPLLDRRDPRSERNPTIDEVTQIVVDSLPNVVIGDGMTNPIRLRTPEVVGKREHKRLG
jgi:hypothetical protein